MDHSDAPEPPRLVPVYKASRPKWSLCGVHQPGNQEKKLIRTLPVPTSDCTPTARPSINKKLRPSSKPSTFPFTTAFSRHLSHLVHRHHDSFHTNPTTPAFTANLALNFCKLSSPITGTSTSLFQLVRHHSRHDPCWRIGCGGLVHSSTALCPSPPSLDSMRWKSTAAIYSMDCSQG
jgi:hypothetical protein